MSRFVIHETALDGPKIIERKPLNDVRGSFVRLFCADDLSAAGWHGPIAQINQSTTATPGTIRGMHYQYPPYAEMKLVTCIAGAVWDVAVDLRRKSPTFLQHFSQTLSVDNSCALLIPPGFAHGFQALSADATLIYLHSLSYVPDAEGGLNAADPRLAIAWPLAAAHMSDRDQGFSFIPDDYKGLIL